MKKGKLFVVSGPSGVGKGTICKEVMNLRSMEFSVSMTTRAPRDGEIDGVHYHFVTKEQFEDEIETGGLLEYAKAYENYYGTPRGKIMDNLQAGKDILLDIEMQGALQVKTAFPEAVLIFILPPSMDILRQRLSARGTETKETLELRLSKILEELEYLGKYDYYIVNDDLSRAVDDCLVIIDSEHSNDQCADKFRIPEDTATLTCIYNKEA